MCINVKYFDKESSETKAGLWIEIGLFFLMQNYYFQSQESTFMLKDKTLFSYQLWHLMKDVLLILWMVVLVWWSEVVF